MERTCSLLILVLLFGLMWAKGEACKPGFSRNKTTRQCDDIDECKSGVKRCVDNAICLNTDGSYNCQCTEGFRSSTGEVSFTGRSNTTCLVINKCQEERNICGPNAKCIGPPPGYKCKCNKGFVTPNGKEEFTEFDDVICRDICVINNTICGNGTCHQGDNGHYCACHSGFSNYGDVKLRCSELNCDIIKDMDSLKEKFAPAYDLVEQGTNLCKEVAESENSTKVDGMNGILKQLLSVIDQLLSGKPFRDNRKVSTFLDTVEGMLKLTGPFSTPPGLNESSKFTDLQLLLHKGSILPQGNVTLSVPNTTLDIQMKTVAGKPSQYPGFAAVSLLTYGKLNESADGFFDGVEKQHGVKTLKINSKIVTVTVTNDDTSFLKERVFITLYHLQQLNNASHCVFWNSSLNGGAWSTHGCEVKESNLNYTVCSCNHLSSFAVLMALYDIEDKLSLPEKFQLELITWVGLSLSIVCLFICILTFGLIRSIQSQRTKIHLHLSISLFLALVIFLIGISRTENKVGCAVVAGLLHFFFLASFCWMCLEGIQLFRMVVLVFNSSFRTLYLMAAGYGVPAVIVSLSAFANAEGYGTERYCWLSLGSIWFFYGPVCVIIFVNIIFFLITVWKLAQKFSSLNPDLENLQKIKTFTVTAVAQLCVLGIMWIFGAFQFEESTIAMTYLFTIFATLQGVLLFILQCLCSKPIRDEYKNILSRCCAPQKKPYSEFGYTNSSKAQVSKASQDTGESHM